MILAIVSVHGVRNLTIIWTAVCNPFLAAQRQFELERCKLASSIDLGREMESYLKGVLPKSLLAKENSTQV